MKRKKLLLALIPLIAATIYSQSIFSQQWTGNQNAYTWNMWSFNVHGGIASYYGDLSIYDHNIKEKINYESGPSFGILATKHFNKVFSISGQLLWGKLEGEKSEISFHSEIFEYNLQLKFDILNLINPNFNNKFGLNVLAGFGQFLFTTTKYEYIEGIMQDFQHDTRVPEFVYFAGGEVYYNFTNNFGITAGLSIRQCQNDKLDNVVDNFDFDYYSIFSIGITYYLTDFIKSPPRNKARIAHNSRRLKHLD